MIKCPSPSLIATVTGPTLEALHLSWYITSYLVLLLLQLQHLHNQHSLSHLQKRVPLLGGLHLRRRLLLISQTSAKNQLIRRVLLPEIARVGQTKRVHAWPSQYQNNHVDVKKSIWWSEDFKETLGKIYRQANNNSASDFKDSELVLQDFINRYVDASASSPFQNLARLAWYHSLDNYFCLET